MGNKNAGLATKKNIKLLLNKSPHLLEKLIKSMTIGETINCQFAMKMLKCCYYLHDPLSMELILKTNLINLNTKEYIDQYINSITDLEISMRYGFDILSCDNYLFHRSLYNGKVGIVKYLLSLNVDPSGNIGYPAIISASVQGLDNIVKLLLNHPNIDPTIQNNKALYLALNMKRINVVNLLLSDGRFNISDIDKQQYLSESGKTILKKWKSDGNIVANYSHDPFVTISYDKGNNNGIQTKPYKNSCFCVKNQVSRLRCLILLILAICFIIIIFQ